MHQAFTSYMDWRIFSSAAITHAVMAYMERFCNWWLTRPIMSKLEKDMLAERVKLEK